MVTQYSTPESVEAEQRRRLHASRNALAKELGVSYLDVVEREKQATENMATWTKFLKDRKFQVDDKNETPEVFMERIKAEDGKLPDILIWAKMAWAGVQGRKEEAK